MKIEYFISIYLDKRRKNKIGKYPVRLRVFTPTPRMQKLYPTSFNFTKDEFKAIWNPTAPKSDDNKALRKEYRKKLQNLESFASKLAGELKPFIFEEFERRLLRKSGDNISVKYYFNEIIAENRDKGHIGSAVAYESSMKSLSIYTEQNKPFDKLTFYDVNENWLNKYQMYMTEDLGKSQTTVGIYLRQFRAVYKRAIAAGHVPKELYPFGEGAFQIQSGTRVKKALNHGELAALYKAKTHTTEQEKARDFWFFSFACSGMNVKDIALLKWKNIQDDQFEYVREKTKSTTSQPFTITVGLNDYSKSIIEKYSTKSTPNSYVFDIVKTGMTPQEIQQRVGNFTRFINQNLKKLCKANDLPDQISVNWARHSHATNAIRKGKSMEFVGETLGHKNFATTHIYFKGFDVETKKEFAQSNMDFIEDENDQL